MGDFVTNSSTSLVQLHDQCNLLQSALHDVLFLEHGGKLDQVRHMQWRSACRINRDR